MPLLNKENKKIYQQSVKSNSLCKRKSKHTKPNAANHNGGIVNKEAAIDVSNVMYVHKGKATRIGFTEKDGKKVRAAKSTGEIID